MKSDQDSRDIEAIKADLYDLDNIIKEIGTFTGEDKEVVQKRVEAELQQTGSNVIVEAQRFGVTPFVFNDNMADFYRNSDGFIYETLIESRNTNRVNKWQGVVNFVLNHTKSDRSETTILLYGDSVGSDSIFLKSLGYDVYYHDFESYCSRFANIRFQKRNLKIKKFSSNLHTLFDFVICLEVAEHVPNPQQLIKDLSLLTAEDGFCIFSESFWMIDKQFPTHIKDNLKFVGKTEEMFEKFGLYLQWRDNDDKPMVYAKRKGINRLIYSKKTNRYLAKILKRLMLARI